MKKKADRAEERFNWVVFGFLILTLVVVVSWLLFAGSILSESLAIRSQGLTPEEYAVEAPPGVESTYGPVEVIVEVN